MANAASKESGGSLPPDVIAARLARYEWMLSDPESARYLLSLLMQARGDRDGLERMIDRIQASKAQASEPRS